MLKGRERRKKVDAVASEDVSMASDEEVEVEEAILPKRKNKKRGNEDGSVVSDEDAERTPRPKQSKGPKVKGVRRNTSMDEGSSSSGDSGDEDTPITKGSLKKLLGHFVREAIQSSSPSPSSRRTKVPRRRRKANEDLMLEKKSDDKGERALYCVSSDNDWRMMG